MKVTEATPYHKQIIFYIAGHEVRRARFDKYGAENYTRPLDFIPVRSYGKCIYISEWFSSEESAINEAIRRGLC